ncbi:hypothetical protein DFH07DRAFT_773351 [Mycena maculata]|uniref:Uncharacterized protein n=1 Tax=Mycena maculata TaxID=230809 RepID=A0AAD7ND48_9AGAR|nr:hypothetical protein DFH07DRAFT_773351 [Mycena maculata]
MSSHFTSPHCCFALFERRLAFAFPRCRPQPTEHVSQKRRTFVMSVLDLLMQVMEQMGADHGGLRQIIDLALKIPSGRVRPHPPTSAHPKFARSRRIPPEIPRSGVHTQNLRRYLVGSGTGSDWTYLMTNVRRFCDEMECVSRACGKEPRGGEGEEERRRGGRGEGGKGEGDVEGGEEGGSGGRGGGSGRKGRGISNSDRSPLRGGPCAAPKHGDAVDFTFVDEFRGTRTSDNENKSEVMLADFELGFRGQKQKSTERASGVRSGRPRQNGGGCGQIRADPARRDFHWGSTPAY